MTLPQISLVTPSYNQGAYLEETIRSVLEQDYPALEYVVIDGGSTDASVDILRRYERDLTYWVSEPDRGQAHAINKGLAHCTGEVFNWINSDDVLAPGALHAVARAWQAKPGRVIAGPVVNFDDRGTEEVITPRALTLENFVRWRSACAERMAWHQPGTFLPLAALRSAGGLREELRYSFDHLLMVDVLQHCEVTYVTETLARFRLHAASKTVSAGHARFRLERLRVLRRMRGLPVRIPSREWHEDMARTLAGCARLDLGEGKRWRAAAHMVEAVWHSPTAARTTWRELSGNPQSAICNSQSAMEGVHA
ncbi:MAG: glycosyltransferase [Gemmatimonadetes bacterium]|nr:glycosyltransferase [Gemmatimonadota bacterium]